MKTVIGITGTTSVGKSAVGVELALMLNGEIISADSMQIYKGMDIGTSKITADEMRGIKHHMLDIVKPNETYSSFLYQQQASKIIDSLETPIMVGGTGFYFDSLIYPPEFGTVGDERRAELRKIYEEHGLEALLEILKGLDIDAYNRIDEKNPKRVMRAIEIAESGGRLSSGVGRNAQPKYDMRLFVLERSRDSLYEQINRRVDGMLTAGLVDEVQNIVRTYGVCDTSAFQAIGYKEIIEYLCDRITFEDAVSKIKLNTRHYAKRQIAYFKKMNVVDFINVEGLDPHQIADLICAKNQFC